MLLLFYALILQYVNIPTIPNATQYTHQFNGLKPMTRYTVYVITQRYGLYSNPAVFETQTRKYITSL